MHLVYTYLEITNPGSIKLSALTELLKNKSHLLTLFGTVSSGAQGKMGLTPKIVFRLGNTLIFQCCLPKLQQNRLHKRALKFLLEKLVTSLFFYRIFLRIRGGNPTKPPD